MKDDSDQQTKDLFEAEKNKRGGARVGAGRKAQQGVTVVKRIPESYAHLVDQLLNHLKEIDQSTSADSVTHSKNIRFNSRVTGEDLQLIVSGIDQDQPSAETSTAPKVKKIGQYKWVTPSHGVFGSCPAAAKALGRSRRTVNDWFNNPEKPEYQKVPI